MISSKLYYQVYRCFILTGTHFVDFMLIDTHTRTQTACVCVFSISMSIVLSVSTVDKERTETHTFSFEGHELGLHLNPALVELELAGLH